MCFALAIIWPFAYGFAFIRSHGFLTATWALGCGLMSSFTLLPVLKKEDINTMSVSRGLLPIDIANNTSVPMVVF